MGGFFAELKRRQMFRVAAAYAVVAWLLLQIVNNVAPVLDLPVWVARALLLALVIGFPIALLFVWMRDLAPVDGAAPKPATTKLDYVLVGGLAAVIALLLYQQLPRSADAPTAAGISIASQEFFSDGVTEEISAVLTRVPNLQVVARTSAFAIDRQNRSVSELGQALGATHLIDGSVRRAGNRVRITAQLVRVDNGLNLWSENFDRELTDIFAIQEDIARAIASALRGPLGVAQGDVLVRNRTSSADSIEEYLRAKALVRARGTQGLRVITDATALLEQVVARDPEFAPGWALLAESYFLTPIFDRARFSLADDDWRRFSDPFMQKAETAAQRAIQLSPNQADGYVSLGSVQANYGKQVLTEELVSKALTLDPNNPDALDEYSFLLSATGRVKEALATRQKLYALEPLVPRFNQLLADALWLNGQDDGAIAIIKTLGGARPHQMAMIHAASGRFSEAADELSTIPSGTYPPGELEAAVRILRTAPASSPQSFPSLGPLGFVYLSIGASDRVLDSVNSIPSSLLWHPSYAAVRKTERFKQKMRNEGILDYWRAKGWPDLCRPVGADDFECD